MSAAVTRKLTLFFPKCECEKPIIYNLVKDYGLIVNVFRAKVTPEEEGYLVLDVTGTEKEIEKALAFLRTFNVAINTRGKGLTWDSVRCTHCGQCLTHCPTHAIRITNAATREIGFDAEKCIECMACIPVCPYGACASAF